MVAEAQAKTGGSPRETQAATPFAPGRVRACNQAHGGILTPRTGDYTDPAGTYAGFTVCADCSGIGVRLQLTDAARAQDHGAYAETMLYEDAPLHGYRETSRDQTTFDRGTWKLLPASAGETASQLCLYPALPRGVRQPASTAECSHVRHQTELVFIDGFEPDHRPSPFPANLNVLLKVRRLSNGREYPMLPVDDRQAKPQ